MWHFSDKIHPQSLNFHLCILEIQVVLAYRILEWVMSVKKMEGKLG